MNDLKKPIIALAVIISSVILAVCLYNQGLFLPGWITWKERTSEFEGGTLSLKNRTLAWQKDETAILMTVNTGLEEQTLTFECHVDGLNATDAVKVYGDAEVLNVEGSRMTVRLGGASGLVAEHKA